MINPYLDDPARTTCSSAEPIDYWREVARRGVMAVGFSVFDHGRGMAAELVAPQTGWVRRAAHAAIEVHKLVAAEPGTPVHAARETLAQELGLGPAIGALAAYQALLLERLWSEIQAAPSARLDALAYPHEDED